jgi:hypothetical protein
MAWLADQSKKMDDSGSIPSMSVSVIMKEPKTSMIIKIFRRLHSQTKVEISGIPAEKG